MFPALAVAILLVRAASGLIGATVVGESSFSVRRMRPHPCFAQLRPYSEHSLNSTQLWVVVRVHTCMLVCVCERIQFSLPRMLPWAPIMQSFSAVVEIRGGSLPRCTATFIEPTVLITAGRCVASALNAAPPDTGAEGAWATAATLPRNLSVWAGPGTASSPLAFVGRVTNMSWVYRAGVFGDNLAVLLVDIASGNRVAITPIPLRTEGFMYPESGAVVGFGSSTNEIDSGSGYATAGTHRSGPAEILEATEVFAYSGNCLRRRDGGALVLQDYNSVQFPKACLASGDYGAALLIRDPRGTAFQLAGVAAQGDNFPCTSVRTYMSSVVYRANWVLERVDFFLGNALRSVVCPSPTPTNSPAPSTTASPTASSSPSPSPSPLVEIVPPRQIAWGVIIALSIVLLFLTSGAVMFGVYYWNRVRLGRKTSVSPGDAKDPDLAKRAAEQAVSRAAAGYTQPQPQRAVTAEDAKQTEQQHMERRRRAKEGRETRAVNRHAIRQQRAKLALKRRVQAGTGEAVRHVRVGNDAMGRFGGTGQGRQLALSSTTEPHGSLTTFGGEGTIASGASSLEGEGGADSKVVPAVVSRLVPKFQGSGATCGDTAPMAPGRSVALT